MLCDLNEVFWNEDRPGNVELCSLEDTLSIANNCFLDFDFAFACLRMLFVTGTLSGVSSTMVVSLNSVIVPTI